MKRLGRGSPPCNIRCMGPQPKSSMEGGVEKPRNYTKEEWQKLSWKQRQKCADAWKVYRAWQQRHAEKRDAHEEEERRKRIVWSRKRRKDAATARASAGYKPAIGPRRLEAEDTPVSTAQKYPHLFEK